MFVVRPHHIAGTPRALARDLGCETRYYPNEDNPRVFDYTKDLFLYPVNPRHVKNAPEGYKEAHHVLTRDKQAQRSWLADMGLPVVRSCRTHDGAKKLKGEKFVVRPMRHEGGEGYRITQDKFDFHEDREYIQELFPKEREYRIVTVFGQPVMYINKQPLNGYGPEDAWGNEASVFQMIRDLPNSYIGKTDAPKRIANCSLVKNTHILGFDILYNSKIEQKWVVLEVNCCPSLLWDGHREVIVEAIKERNEQI